MSIKILAATGIETLDGELEKILPEYGMSLVNTCYHKAVLERVVEITGADTVIISPDLPGEGDLIEIAFKLRVNRGKRVVVLAGDLRLEETRKLIARLASMHIYDFLYNTGSNRVKAEDVVKKLLKPGDMSDIPIEVRDAVEIGSGRVYADISEKIEKAVSEVTESDSNKKKLPGFIKKMFSGDNQGHPDKKADDSQDITETGCENIKTAPVEKGISETKPPVKLTTMPVTVKIKREASEDISEANKKMDSNFNIPDDPEAMGHMPGVRSCSNIREKEQPRKETKQQPEQEPKQEAHDKNDIYTETIEYSSEEEYVSNKTLRAKPTKKSNGFRIPSILPKKEQPGAVTYVSHPLIAVWNPTGSYKSVTSLNLAVAAARTGLDTVLVEMDLSCPILDIWMGIQQTSIEDFKVNSDQGIGILTLGENIKPEHVSRLLQKTPWGVSYLPAGNKLGNIGTPDLTVEQMAQIINTLYHRDVKGKPAATVLDLGTSYEYPQTIAALRQATVVLIPLDGSQQESIMAQQQLSELARGGISPKSFELIWHMAGVNKPKPVCNLQLTIPVDLYGYMKASVDRKPYCLISSEGQKVWGRVLQEIMI